MQKDAKEIKDKIIRLIRERGPSMPIQLGSGIGLSMIFTSAFLSELVGERAIKMTYMRVGSSPVYYIEGQEEGLEKYSQYLKSKEKEAYELLRANRFLNDAEQLPAIRVALQAIKDFAIRSEVHQGIWRYFLAKDSEYISEETPRIENKQEIKEKSEEKQRIEEETIEVPVQEEKTEEIIEEKQIIKQEIKGAPSSMEFIDKVKYYLEKLKIKVLEETETKKKDISWIGRTENNLGEIEILIIGKDKKSVTDKDFEKIEEEVKAQNKTALFLCTGELAKKTKETYRNYKNIIFFQKID